MVSMLGQVWSVESTLFVGNSTTTVGSAQTSAQFQYHPSSLATSTATGGSDVMWSWRCSCDLFTYLTLQTFVQFHCRYDGHIFQTGRNENPSCLSISSSRWTPWHYTPPPTNPSNLSRVPSNTCFCSSSFWPSSGFRKLYHTVVGQCSTTPPCWMRLLPACVWKRRDLSRFSSCLAAILRTNEGTFCNATQPPCWLSCHVTPYC